MGKGKVVVGMSGGVDSSVAAYLLKEQGYEVIGVTMLTLPEQTASEGCGSFQLVEDARSVAKSLSIPHDTIDFSREFQCHVMDYFVDEYLCGRTPNPCNACNRYIKWQSLLAKAEELGADYIATGHYARIDHLPNGRAAIRNSVTAQKDQTYALYNLTQHQLSHTLMPVGEYTKDVIRQIAEKIGRNVASKPDSQDICFIPDHDYGGFIRRQGKCLPGEGEFVDREGKFLGKNKGYYQYTIGQRKGLNLAMGHPVFVTEICPETNRVVIGESEELFHKEVLVEKMNFMALPELMPGQEVEVAAKIRYSHKGAKARLRMQEDGLVSCRFDEPQRAMTPGQALVCYQGEYVACGGTMIRVMD